MLFFVSWILKSVGIPSDCLNFFDNSPLSSLFSWFVGPQVSLQDCLAAFFAKDELKGKLLIFQVYSSSGKIDRNFVSLLKNF